MSLRTILYLGFGIVLLFAAVQGVVSTFGMTRAEQQFALAIEQDAPIMANVWRLAKLVVDMETGQRGFVITGKEEFLAPYRSGVSEFGLVMEKQKRLIADSGRDQEGHRQQIEVLDRIAELVSEWREKAAEPEIAMRRSVATHDIDAEHLQAILRGGVGKGIVDKFMVLGDELEVSFSDRGDWEGAFAVEVIEKCVADREGAQRGFLITGREEFLDKYVGGEQTKLPEYFARLRAIVAERGRDDELSKKVDQLEQLNREWALKAAEPEIAARREMNKHPETLKDVASLLEAGTGKALLDEVREECDDFAGIERRLAESRYRRVAQMAGRTRNLGIGLLVIAAFSVVLVALLVTSAVTRPLARMAMSAEAVGRGDFDTEITVGSGDEVGKLAGAFNAMSLALKKTSEMRSQAEERLAEAHGKLQGQVGELEQAQESSLSMMEDLEHEVTERRKTERQLNERVKELNAFYHLSTIVEEGEGTIDSICASMAEYLPQCWRYPEIACCKIVLEDREFQSRNFAESEWMQSGHIRIGGMEAGEVIVGYLGKRADLDEGPFLKEERMLLNALAERIGRIAERRRAQEDLEELNTDLERSNQDLQEFTYTVSHDLQAPLRKINTFGKFLEEDCGDVLSDEGRNHVRRMQVAALRMKELIQHLLRLSRVGTASAELKPVEPREIIQTVLSDLSDQIGECGAAVTIEDGLPAVMADKVQFGQLLQNLIGNAMKFCSPDRDPRICISAERNEKHATFRIADNGIGIEEEYREKVFGIFKRLHSREKYEGTGIGLALCEKIVRRHSGRIWVESEPGEGSDFCFTLKTV